MMESLDRVLVHYAVGIIHRDAIGRSSKRWMMRARGFRRLARPEELIERLELSDANDRHVSAAAVRSGADVIVTQNLKDFPEEKLDPYGIEAQHPDTFITFLFDLNAGAVLAAAQEHRASLKSRRGAWTNT